jgi:hypothetical protein
LRPYFTGSSQPFPKLMNSKNRFVVQHEFDDEPTYVVDNQIDPNVADEALVTFDPRLPSELRERLGWLIAAELAKTNPKLLTEGELLELKETHS